MTPPFQVRTAGFVWHQRYHSTPGTKQGDVMLTVFLDGRGTYRNSCGVVPVEKNMVGLVPPEDPGVLMADPAAPYVHYYCRFNGAYAFHMVRQILADQGERFFPVLDAEELAGCLRRMGRYGARELPVRMGRREALLVQALTTIQMPAGAREGGRELKAIALEEYLRDRIADPTDLDRMAAYFGVSKTSLCRAAKKLCGRTVLAMHEAMKVEWSQTLLRLGTLNVTEVALRVGYADPFYFSRVFKKHVGRSPKQWASAEKSTD